MTASQDRLRLCLIMAGGAGERFWPLSRKNRPKQLLPLAHPEKSLLEEAVERVTPLIPPECILVVTGEHLRQPILESGLGLPERNILAEPAKRNTAGAIAYATAWILAQHPERDPESITLAILTADHRIGETERFREVIATALHAAETQDALVTCGIVPTRPDTGFGYIKLANVWQTSPSARAETPKPHAVPVDAFIEKPDLDHAQAFLASGDYLWNSGMFFWKLSTFLDELHRARPELHHALGEMRHALEHDDPVETTRIFLGLENLSIDVALMEQASRVLAVPGDFPWHDIGSWTAFAETQPKDDHGNVLIGGPIVHDATGCIIYNAPGAQRMAVAVSGLDDVIVVTTEDAVLVLPKDRAQDVRQIVQALREMGGGYV